MAEKSFLELGIVESLKSYTDEKVKAITPESIGALSLMAKGLPETTTTSSLSEYCKTLSPYELHYAHIPWNSPVAASYLGGNLGLCFLSYYGGLIYSPPQPVLYAFISDNPNTGLIEFLHK